MIVYFENIYDHIIPMNDFELKHYDNLPQLHLSQLKPLHKMAATFIWKYISDLGLHDDVPFKAIFLKLSTKQKIIITTNRKLNNGYIIVAFRLTNKSFNLFYYPQTIHQKLLYKKTTLQKIFSFLQNNH